MGIYMIRWILLGLLIAYWMIKAIENPSRAGASQSDFENPSKSDFEYFQSGHQSFLADPTPIHAPNLPKSLIPSKAHEIQEIEESLERMWTLARPQLNSPLHLANPRCHQL